jgi:hypothetical protein
MFAVVLGAAIFAQALVAPVQAYTVPGPTSDTLQLVMPTGRGDVELGFNCSQIGAWRNVEVWQITNVPGQVVVAPIDNYGRVVIQEASDDGGITSALCGAAFVSDVIGSPCQVDDDGRCDVAFEASRS